MRFRNQEQPTNLDYNNGGIPCAGCGALSQMPAMPMPMSMPMTAPQQNYQLPAMGGQQLQPALPTGFPTGGTTTPLLPSSSGMPATPINQQVPATVQSPIYTPGFLRTQIGKRMRVEFLIGTNLLTDRTGTLLAVGASYILLQPIDSDDILLCDIYSIKFVTIIS